MGNKFFIYLNNEELEKFLESIDKIEMFVKVCVWNCLFIKIIVFIGMWFNEVL